MPDKKIARSLEKERDVAALRELYRSATIGRRAFLSRLAALGIGTTVAGLIVAGTPVTAAAAS